MQIDLSLLIHRDQTGSPPTKYNTVQHKQEDHWCTLLTLTDRLAPGATGGVP